jgi:cardiolipin synthase
MGNNVNGNELQFFTESGAYLHALRNDFLSARKRIWIESYTISDDEKLRDLMAVVREKASSGLDCRVTYDAVGSFQTASRFWDEMKESGVKVYAYRPLRYGWWRTRFLQRFQRRSHRKLIVVDEQISYFGGMNLADLGGSANPPSFEMSAPAQPAWRDVQVRMAGEATAKVAKAFLALRPETETSSSQGQANPSRAQVFSSAEEAIYFIDSRPRMKYRRPAPYFRSLIRRANTRITIAMAYFLPFGGVLRTLRKAARRGVAIEVIVPAESDVRLVQWATQHMYEKLIKQGFAVYERRDQMLHSKVMVVDGEWSVVGSCNFDPRSFLINLEFFAIIRSKGIAQQLNEILDYERANSNRIGEDSHRKSSLMQRLIRRIAWSFRRWL